jgi:hypothetical protein
MKLTIITPCTRPENLPAMHTSISVLPWIIDWIIVYNNYTMLQQGNRILTKYYLLNDLMYIRQYSETGGVSGNAQRNKALNIVIRKLKYSGWIYFLDDDNLIHPEFRELETIVTLNPWTRGIIFGQDIGLKYPRLITPETVKTNHIDQAQYCLHTDLIQKKRFEQKYEADGIFIENIYQEKPDKFIITDRVMSYYNYLKR